MTDTEKQPELPAGWCWTTIGEICDLTNGRAFKPDEWSSHGIPIVRIQNLNNKKAEFNYCDFQVDEKYYFSNGQLLFCWSGTPGTSFGAHIWNRGAAVLNQHIFKVNINENYVDKIYLMHLMNWNVKEYVKKAHGTAGLAHITKNKFETSHIPLPPLPEQHRIVKKIEELFTDLDVGVQALEKAKIQVKNYRQAVLRAAVEGRLTEEWRKENPDVESANSLISKIEEFNDHSVDKKKRANKLPSFDSTNLPSIPKGWIWTRLDSIADIKGGITKDSKRKIEDGKEVPYLRVANVQRGFLDLSEMKYIEASESAISELLLMQGDILFTEGGDRDKLGRGWIWQNEIPECIHQNHIFRARLYSKEISSKFVSWFSNTHSQYFMKEGKQTTNLASINLTKLRAYPLSIPPAEEQKVIVSEIERRFSVIDQIEKTIDQSLAQAEKLRQSILKKAFEGKLVPQDPEDEPASVLLEKIRQEKAEIEALKKPAKTKAKAKAKPGNTKKAKQTKQTELV